MVIYTTVFHTRAAGCNNEKIRARLQAQLREVRVSLVCCKDLSDPKGALSNAKGPVLAQQKR